MLFNGRRDLAIAAYSAGPRAVIEAGSAVPSIMETMNYVKILPLTQQYGGLLELEG